MGTGLWGRPSGALAEVGTRELLGAGRAAGGQQAGPVRPSSSASPPGVGGPPRSNWSVPPRDSRASLLCWCFSSFRSIFFLLLQEKKKKKEKNPTPIYLGAVVGAEAKAVCVGLGQLAAPGWSGSPEDGTPARRIGSPLLVSDWVGVGSDLWLAWSPAFLPLNCFLPEAWPGVVLLGPDMGVEPGWAQTKAEPGATCPGGLLLWPGHFTLPERERRKL